MLVDIKKLVIRLSVNVTCVFGKIDAFLSGWFA